ncbi:hypothetical protein ACHAXR_005065 [Thalassiosira sp. AJA248-18]
MSAANPSALPVPPAIKPTSRARTYRIPNTSDAAAAGALAENNHGMINTDSDNANMNSNSAAPESFLWATREIAALDFLMNVPLKSEKDVVRAGLSGGRWHRQHHARESTKASTNLNFSSGIEDIAEENKSGVPSNSRNLSSFDIARSSIGIEEEATTNDTESSIHTQTLIGEHSKNHAAAGGRWWDKLILKDTRFFSAANQQAQRREQLEMEEKELERPTESPSLVMMTSVANGGNGSSGISFGAASMGNQNKRIFTSTPSSANAAGGVPGRRLDGREAVTIEIPEELRRPVRTVARQAAVREWEIGIAYGAQQGMKQHQPPNHLTIGSHYKTKTRNALLDGRVFFSTKKSYPVALMSTIKYEPEKEETLRKRRQLEELGGGGTQFVLPERDWRGISYRALLPQVGKPKQNKAFNRLLRGNASPAEKGSKKVKPSSPRNIDTSSSGEDIDDTSSLSSSEESDCGAYYPGFLDDPHMVQGRNRNVMMGDKVTGPIISSTIQFIKPSVLKADLNKQFRERFDQWEPPKSQRKYIGAQIIDGVYTLIDPTETMQEDDDVDNIRGRLRAGSVSAQHEREKIRMPPSLTLSKIRSLKQQALVACIRARIEISTLALACIYFERLCLACRVDKSNRRLSFAACLLLAAKVNESNSMIAYDRGVETKSDGSQLPLMTSWVKPNKKSGKIFESLIVFFTHDWSLSLKQLYAAEWIVFTALGFSLKAAPSEVAFHFKRLLRVLEWNPRSYLGSEMYRQWKESLMDESRQNEMRKVRHEARIKRNERNLLKLQHKLHLQQHTEELSSRSSRRSSTTIGSADAENGNPLFRRHSVDVADAKHAEQVHQDNMRLESPGRLSRNSKKREGVAIRRGILSRLSRQKQGSHGKDLDKMIKSHHLTKTEKNDTTYMKQSVSVPNLASLDSKKKYSSVGFDINEGGNEDEDVGLFI